MHEVTQGVEGLGLPVHCGVGLLVDWSPVAGVLDVQWLEVVHGPGYQITCKIYLHMRTVHRFYRHGSIKKIKMTQLEIH